MKHNLFTLSATILMCCLAILKAEAQTNSFASKVILTFVNAPEDDAEENLTTGITNINSADLKLNSAEKIDQLIGMRFTNLNIPQGAIISSARLVYNVDELKDGWNELEIYAESVDKATAFNDTKGNISTRTKTEAVVHFDKNSEWMNINGSYTSPNIAPIIQEIVDRTGWQEMNAIALLIKGTGGNTAISYDGNPNLPPMLIVNYMGKENVLKNTPLLTNDVHINEVISMP